MKVLILEDDASRIKWFRLEIPPSWEKFITKDVEEAKKLLTEHEFDYIFLDHDLEESHFSKPISAIGTGYEVALWLEDNPAKQSSSIIFIHSCNACASIRMKDALKGRNRYAIPFPLLKDVLEFED